MSVADAEDFAVAPAAWTYPAHPDLECVGDCQGQKTLAQALMGTGVAVPGYVDFEDFCCRAGNVPVSVRNAR